jgi:hypothetical protein
MGTDEFADVVVTARSQVSSTLRQLASMVDGERHTNNSNGNGDLVARVRNLVGSD